MTRGRRIALAYLLLLPGLGVILVFMVIVVGMAVAQSFGALNFAGAGHVGLGYWQKLMGSHQLWRAFFYSLRIATLSALLAVAFAYPLALWLRKPFPGSDTMAALLKAPLLVHGLVAAFLYVNFVSFGGFLNLALVRLGIVARPLRMQNDPWGMGVLILQIWKQMPMALLLLTAATQAIGDDILNAARDLGARPWARFRRVIFPLTLRAAQAALVLIFIGAAGDFSFQTVAGPTSVNSLAQFMVRMQQSGPEGWNLAAVVAVMLMATAIVGSVALAALVGLISRWARA